MIDFYMLSPQRSARFPPPREPPRSGPLRPPILTGRMDLITFTPPDIYVHLALLCYICGFLVRDELVLRSMVLLGSFFYVLYYYFISDPPLWAAIFSSGAIICANLFILVQVLAERSMIGLSASDRALYAEFVTLNPGQFRALMRHAQMIEAVGGEVLCRAGAVQSQLYLIQSGDVVLDRGGKRATVGQGQFIGEVSFLLGGTASATVTAQAGARYVAWDHAVLRRLMAKSPALSNALLALLNGDIARKLAVSSPDNAL